MLYNIEDLKEEALALVTANIFPAIESQEDFSKAGDVLKVIKNKIAAIEIKRKTYTDPLLKQQKLIKADFDKAAEPYVQFVEDLETQMKQFWQEEKRRVDALQAKMDEEAKKNAGVDGALVPIVNDIKTSRGDLASTTVRELTRYKVIDISKVPLAFLMVDDKAMKAHIDTGKAAPAGIEYFSELSVTSR